jgi:AraC-like DNA-binding protein
MRALTVQAGYASALIKVAVSRGVRPDALTRQAGIRAADLADAQSRLAFGKYVALMRAGQALCQDPALALHFGESLEVADSSIGFVVGAFAESMEEGFALMDRSARLTVEVELDADNGRFVPVRSASGVWIVDTRRNANDFPELTESTFARMACLGRQTLGDDFVRAVQVTHPKPRHAPEYTRVFRAPVAFGSESNALLTSDWTTWKPLRSSRLVMTCLVARADALLEQLGSSVSTRSRVERLVKPLLHTGETSIGGVARKLGLSRQTLFRRLRAEGTTFEAVLGELRRDAALRCLSQAGASVKRAAYLAGFSEPPAFSRAFKRWTGSTPRDYLADRRREGGPIVTCRVGHALGCMLAPWPQRRP